MIKKIILNRFGKFTNKSFALQDVTLFYGKNESGKTTLFDAFLQGLCSPKANKKTGQQLKRRYGENFSVDIDFAGSKQELDEDEFLNLYAIRSGDIGLELSSNSSWMEKVKSRLFTGGIDPLVLKNKFEALASVKGSLKHNKELTKYTEDYNRELEKCKELNAKRNSLIQREKNADSAQQDLKNIENEIEGKLSLKKKLEEDIENSKCAREKLSITDFLIKMESADKRKDEISMLKVFDTVKINEIDELEKHISENQKNLEIHKQKTASLRESVESLENTSRALGAEYNKQKIIADLATGYIREANSFISQAPLKKITKYNRLLVIISIITALAGAGSILIFQDAILRIIVPLSCLFIAVILFVFSRKETTIKDTEKENQFIKWIKDEWANRASELLSSATITGLLEELQNKRGKLENIGKQMTLNDEEILRNNQMLKRLNQELHTLNEMYTMSIQKETDWLKKFQVQTRDEFIKKSIEYETLVKTGQQWNRLLSEEMSQYGFSEPAQLAWHLKNRLKELESKNLPAQAPTEADIKKREVQYKTLLDEIESNKQRFNSLNNLNAQETGKLSESLGSLCAQILDCEQLLVKIKQRIDELNLNREAAAIARDIFNQIALDTGSVMKELSIEISALFGKVVPELRCVEVSALDTESLRISDQAGTMRAIDHLSRGTRDAFLIAARLALAKKASPGNGLLVFDEPFYALDNDRIKTALKMISLFQSQNRWQLVFLTKDIFLKEQVTQYFSNAGVYEL